MLQQVERDILESPLFDPQRAEISFRLAMSDVAEAVFVPPLIQHLAVHAPLASIHIESPNVGPLYERLSGGEVNLAIGYFSSLEKDMCFRQPLYSHTYACIARKGHPVTQTGMSRAAYQAFGHAVVATPARVNALLETAIERQRIRRRIVMSTPNHLALSATIARSDLLTTVPLGTAIDLARSGELAVLPLPFRPPSFTVFQYWHRRTHREFGFRWLRAQLKTLFNPQTDPYAEQRRALYGAR